MLKRFLYIVFVISLTLGYSQELQKISLQLNWKHQFEFAGYYMAKEKGFYRELGLDVTIKELKPSQNILNDIINGKSDFGIGHPTLVLDKSKGADIVLLSAIFQSSPLALMTLKSSGIKNFKDFKHKKLMITKDEAKSVSILSMFLANSIKMQDLQQINNNFNLKDFLDKKVDIYACYTTNEPYILDTLKVPYTLWDPKDYGFDFYDDILFTSQKMYEKHPQIVENFTKATLRGWRYALNHISETINLIKQKYNTQHKSRKSLFYEAIKTKELVYYKTQHIGYIDKNKIGRIYDIYHFLGYTKNKIDLDKFVLEISNQTSLTTKELDYIQNNKVINVCTNPNWTPIEFTSKKGIPQGISIDTLGIVADRLGLKINYIKTNSWSQSQTYLKEKKCDILPAAIKTYKREKYAIFTKPYLTYNLAIITRNDEPLVPNLEKIIDKTMARKKGSGLITKLKRKYPKLKIIETKGYKESFQDVADGKVYFTIATLPVLSYFKRKYGIKNLQIAGYTNMKYNLCIAVRKDDPILRDILDKALLNISKSTKNIIYDRWTQREFVKRMDYSLFYKMLILFLILFIVFIAMAIILKKHNNMLSKEIQERQKAEENLKILNATLDLKIKVATENLQEQNNKLKESIDNFQNILDVTLETILFINSNREIVDINKSGIKTFGYDSKEELIGKHISTLIPMDQRSIVDKEIRKEISGPFEVTLLKKDGSFLYALVSGRNIIKDGKTIRMSSIMDLTSLKQKDKQLQQQSRLAQMGEMISMIAHQWRQPLSAISATSGSLNLKARLNKIDNDTIIELSNKITQYTKHLSSTIDDFRDFFKADKEQKLTNYEDIIQSVMNIIESSIINHDIKIVKDFQCIENFVSYPNEIKQVLLNLIKNAEDILIEKHIKDPIILIRTYRKNDFAVLEVEDNAGGVPAEIKDKIFDPYFSTKDKRDGTGLGLYMSKIIIEEHCKGRLQVQNSDNGAIFRIVLKL